MLGIQKESENNMSKMESVLFSIADHPTPKICEGGVAYTLNSRDYKASQVVAYRKQGHPQNADQGQGWEEARINDTLTSYDNTDARTPTLILKGDEMESIVRRLTPLECERLQGYPDGWTDIGEWTDSKGKIHKDADSPRYKALGNSIALPFWDWMAGRICGQYDRKVEMASLFDGIGGFPLCFERHGAVPVWASEIEEFPIAVTKVRFPEEG